jgi:hypothetical protein
MRGSRVGMWRAVQHVVCQAARELHTLQRRVCLRPHRSVRQSTPRVHGHIFLCHPGHSFSLDNDLIDHHAKSIGIIGVGLYTALARHAGRKTGACGPSIGRLAHLLDRARSTIKIYLRKLEACGLITITPHHDEAGDATSHLSTLLDPAPIAIDQRRAAHEAAVAAVPEGGRLSADPPPAACQSTGRLPADPEPSVPETNEVNQAGGCSSAQEEGTKAQARTCEHSPEEQLHFGEVAVCHHC